MLAKSLPDIIIVQMHSRGDTILYAQRTLGRFVLSNNHKFCTLTRRICQYCGLGNHKQKTGRQLTVSPDGSWWWWWKLVLPDKLLMSHAAAMVTTFQSSIEPWVKDLLWSIYVLIGGVHRANIFCFLDPCTGIKFAFNPGLPMLLWSHQLGSSRLLSFRLTCPELNLLPIVKCSQNYKV